jgi:hypothetical protein
MRRASWESSAGALAALLNGTGNNQLVMVDLYTITTPGGLTLRWTNAPLAVTVNSVTWSPGPLIRRGRTRIFVGIEVDTLDLTLSAPASVTVSGVPLMQFLANRGLDDARFTLERGFAGSVGAAIVGTLPLFIGRIAQVRAVTRMEARLTVNSDTELLDVKVPRNVYQPPCLNTLYDAACGVSRAANTVSSTAQSVTDAARMYFTHNLAAAAATYDLGVVIFTSGANTGISRTVRSYETVAGSGRNRITLMGPLPAAVSIGDAYTVSKGCDRQQATCNTKFANQGLFRGTPYVPTPESIV